jgi:6-phosphogluconolactonase (cycloisomerase 2 family)
MSRAARLGIGLVVLLWAALLPGTAAATTENATSVVVSPNGSTVYAGSGGAGFSVFSRDPGTGELSFLAEAPTTASGGPLESPAIAASPDGANVYGVDSQSNTMFQYAPTSGGVAGQGSYPVLADTSQAKDPTSLVVSPDGSSVYVLTYGVQYGTGVGVTTDGKINAFARNPSTGNLTLTQTAPIDADSASEGIVAEQPVLSPDGNFIYVTSNASGGIDMLNTPDLGATPTREGTLNGGTAIAISQDGNYVLETGPPSSSDSNASEIAVLSRNPSTGNLTQVDGANDVSGLSDMWGLAVSPTGNCVYATSRADNSLGWFSLSSGTLTLGGVVSEGENGVSGLADARQVTVSPDGKNLYVASPGDGAVAVFSLNPTTCVPSFLQEVQDLFALASPVLDPTSGTATLPVNVVASGAINLALQALGNGPSVRAAVEMKHAIPVSGPALVDLPISLTGQAEQELDEYHQLSVQAAVTFTATGGTPTTKTVEIQLLRTAPSLSHLRVVPRSFSLAGRLVKRHCVAQTRNNQVHPACRRPLALAVSYSLNQATAVTFTVASQQPGREARRSCVKPTRKNRKARKCTRLIKLAGKITQSGKMGANRFTFIGKIGGRRLGAGTYTLTLTPSGGKAVNTTFRLTD